MMRVLFLMGTLALLASCRSTKKIGTAITKRDTVQATPKGPNPRQDSMIFIKATLQKLAQNRIDFTSFTAKVDVDYRDADNKNHDVNAVMRMYKDSAIWISANAILGIEALRVLITKDSVKLLDKLNKVYTARSVNYLQEVTSLPLNLKTLQDLIIGNPVFLDSNVVSYSNRDNVISILSIGQWFKNLLTLNEGDKTLLRSKLDDADLSRNRTADLTYSDYESKNGLPFATKRRITIAENKKLDIKLEFKQIGFNDPVSFPFSVPKNYRTN